MSVTDGPSWGSFQLISCVTEVKIKARSTCLHWDKSKVNTIQSEALWCNLWSAKIRHMAGDTVTVCLHAFVSVFVASRWWEWTHMPWQRDHRNPTSPSLHHHPTTSSPRSIKGHTWPLTPLESILIGGKCLQWPSRNNAQWSVRGRGGREGGILYLSSLPPYKPRSRAVSQQARNKRGAYFSIWGTKGIGHGDGTIQPLKKEKLRETSSDCFEEWKEEEETLEVVRLSFKRQSKNQQKEI